jgi:predicted TPR repeat methyltransferase
MSRRSDIHDRVLNASSLKDIEDAYRDWAGNYDRELVDDSGYVAPRQCAATLSELLPGPDAVVLDAGCGTGLVGHYLAGAGVSTIDGLDYSRDMLEVAAAKGCYRELMQADLNGPLDIESDRYDATVCVGTFTSGHVGPEALFELIRVTSKQGPVCFTVRDSFWRESQFTDVIDETARRGLATVVSSTEVPYIEKEGSTCHQVVMRVA